LSDTDVLHVQKRFLDKIGVLHLVVKVNVLINSQVTNHLYVINQKPPI